MLAGENLADDWWDSVLATLYQGDARMRTIQTWKEITGARVQKSYS